jgi:hypothetical protein
MWLMGDEFMGKRKYNGCIIPFGYKTDFTGSISEGVIGIFH